MSARSLVASYWAGAAALTAAVIAKPAWAPFAWVLLGILAVTAILVGARRNASAQRWPWHVLAAAILISTAADLLNFSASGSAEADLLAVMNVLYLVSTIAAIGALLRFGRSDTSGLAPAGLIDALIVIVVLLLLV